MKMIELPSLGTTQPTMFCHSVVMNNKFIRKFRKAGYRSVKSYKGFKWCRHAIKKMVEKDYNISGVK